MLTAGFLPCLPRTPSCFLLLEQVTCQKEVFFSASSYHLTSQSPLTRAVRREGLLWCSMWGVSSTFQIHPLEQSPQGPGCFAWRLMCWPVSALWGCCGLKWKRICWVLEYQVTDSRLIKLMLNSSLPWVLYKSTLLRFPHRPHKKCTNVSHQHQEHWAILPLVKTFLLVSTLNYLYFHF